jgi:hypothetical protein
MMLDFSMNPCAKVFRGGADTIPQADPKGDGTHIQVFILQHLYGTDNFFGAEHGYPIKYRVRGLKGSCEKKVLRVEC